MKALQGTRDVRELAKGFLWGPHSSQTHPGGEKGPVRPESRASRFLCIMTL